MDGLESKETKMVSFRLSSTKTCKIFKTLPGGKMIAASTTTMIISAIVLCMLGLDDGAIQSIVQRYQKYFGKQATKF